MKRRRYHFTHREQLDAFQQRLQEKWLRRDLPYGHLEIRQPVLRQSNNENNSFEVGWSLQLSSKWGSYGQWHDVPEELLEELHDMIGQLLELKPEPVRVIVEQPKRRRLRPRPKPAEQLVDKSSTALAPDEQAILHRMLEGK